MGTFVQFTHLEQELLHLSPHFDDLPLDSVYEPWLEIIKIFLFALLAELYPTSTLQSPDIRVKSGFYCEPEASDDGVFFGCRLINPIVK